MRPILCYTCGKVLGNKWECIDKLLEDGVELKEIYEMINVIRYCCKRTIMTSVDVGDIENQLYEIPENITIHKTNAGKTFMRCV